MAAKRKGRKSGQPSDEALYMRQHVAQRMENVYAALPASASAGLDVVAVIQSLADNDPRYSNAQVRDVALAVAAAVDALREIATARWHSLLEEVAYQGAPTKKWLEERAHYSNGYNDALQKMRSLAGVALARCEVSQP